MNNTEAISQLESLNKEVSIYSEAIDLAIAALEQQEKAFDEWCPDCKEYDKENHCCYRFAKVIRQTVEECKKEWPDSKWYPVKEKLPEENGTYPACYEDATVLLDWFNGKWFFYRTNPAIEETGTVIAWRPLPEPYQEDKE